jgi:hypothetical protein
MPEDLSGFSIQSVEALATAEIEGVFSHYRDIGDIASSAENEVYFCVRGFFEFTNELYDVMPPDCILAKEAHDLKVRLVFAQTVNEPVKMPLLVFPAEQVPQVRDDRLTKPKRPDSSLPGLFIFIFGRHFASPMAF